MKAIEIHERFGLDQLRLTDRPQPEVGPGRVLLRMRAASLNYRDLLTVLGHYNPKQTLPLIPGSDGVGEVVEIGAGVTRVKVGERVTPIFAQEWLSGEPERDKLRSTLGGPLDGVLCELMELDEGGMLHVPDHLSDEEGATLPCAALTAWNSVVTHGNVTAGSTMLVQGTGGVSIFALQFGVMLGARVIVTSSSDVKLERARELGAWKTINYKSTPVWGLQTKKLTGGRGVDLVVEVGGAGTLAQSLVAVRFGGQVSQIGVLSGVAEKLNLIPILMQQIRVQGIMVGSREDFEAMNRAITTHELRPVIDRVFPLEQTREALDHMAAGAHLGKICIRMGTDLFSRRNTTETSRES